MIRLPLGPGRCVQICTFTVIFKAETLEEAYPVSTQYLQDSVSEA